MVVAQQKSTIHKPTHQWHPASWRPYPTRLRMARKNENPEPGENRWTREFSRLSFVLKEVFDGKNHRGPVVAAMALVDSALEMALRHTFMVCGGATEADCNFMLTTGGIPPLRSTSIRAKMAFCLGHIDRGFLNAIITANDIRNHFAHGMNPDPLKETELDSLLAHLPKELRVAIREKAKELPGDDQLCNTYVATCAVLHGWIFAQTDRLLGDYVPGERYGEKPKRPTTQRGPAWLRARRRSNNPPSKKKPS